MSKSLSNRAIQRILGRTPNWIKPFDVNDYLNNRPMIEKLYEERQMALAKVNELEKEISVLLPRIDDLEITLQKLKIQLTEKTSRSLATFVLSLTATISLGIGVNVITSSDTLIWLGWFLVGITVVLEVVAFGLTRTSKEK